MTSLPTNDGGERVWPHLPFPFGFPDALEKVGATAAPLLAGFAFALIGLNVGQRTQLGEPDLAMLLLVGAGLFMIYAVQLMFVARQYYVGPSDYQSFLKLAETDGIDRKVVTSMHIEYLQSYDTWANRTRLAYNLGVVVLLLGVAATLIPKTGIAHMAPLRAAAVLLLCVGASLEAALVVTELPRRMIRRCRNKSDNEPPAAGNERSQGP